MERAAPSSLLDLAPGGGCLAVNIAVDAGGLLHHLFTLTALHPEGRQRGYLFLWPIQQIAPLRAFPGAAPCGVRTFLGLACARPRPPDRPEALSSYTRAEEASTARTSPILTPTLPFPLLQEREGEGAEGGRGKERSP